MSETELLFKKYLDRIKEAYEQTEIKSHGWYYSLSSTPLYKNAVLLCGFNWGVGGEHNGQVEYPQNNFLELDDLGSLKRTVKPLDALLPNEMKEKIVQTNLCFFRSKSEKEISSYDLAKSVEIFIDLLKDLQPKIFIGLSARIAGALKECLEIADDSLDKTITIADGKRTIIVYQRRLKKDYGGGKFFYIPHPNYRMKAVARKTAWEIIK